MFRTKVWGETANEFIPARFLDSNGKYIGGGSVCNEMIKHGLVPFSVGKRDCLGKALADRELTLFFVSLMNQFEFQKIEVIFIIFRMLKINFVRIT